MIFLNQQQRLSPNFTVPISTYFSRPYERNLHQTTVEKTLISHIHLPDQRHPRLVANLSTAECHRRLQEHKFDRSSRLIAHFAIGELSNVIFTLYTTVVVHSVGEALVS